MPRPQQEGAPGAPTADMLGMLGAVVRARRRARGWSLRHLAQVAGVSYSSLCEFETGRGAMDLAPFLRVAVVLGVPILPGLIPPPECQEAARLGELLLVVLRAPPATVDAVQTLLGLATTSARKARPRPNQGPESCGAPHHHALSG